MINDSLLQQQAEQKILQFAKDKLALRYPQGNINDLFLNTKLHLRKNTWRFKQDTMRNYDFNLYVNDKCYDTMFLNYQEVSQLLFEGLYTIDSSFLEGPVLQTKIYRSSNIYNENIVLYNTSHNETINNQGIVGDSESRAYNGLNFKSKSEINIAQELDKRHILFYPLPAASFGGIIKEPDFMVQHPVTKRWGILEVNGPYHDNSAKDHKRSRLFFENGLLCQFYTAEESYNNPSNVIENFLFILSNSTFAPRKT